MRGLSPSTQLWLAAWGMLQERSDTLFRLLTRDCKRLDIENVHDLRIASRRMREGLALFSPCFPKRHLTSLRARLKRLTRILGAIRDTDEALHFFSLLPLVMTGAGAVAAERLAGDLQREREDERSELKKSLRAVSPTALRILFDQTCNNPLIFNSRKLDPLQPVGPYLKTSVAVRERPLLELAPQAVVEENVAAQHRLRIAIKRFRYRMEYLAFAADSGYADLYGQIKQIQDLLGHLHDLDVFADMVRERVDDAAGREALLQLIARRRHDVHAEFLRQNRLQPVTALGDRLRSLL